MSLRTERRRTRAYRSVELARREAHNAIVRDFLDELREEQAPAPRRWLATLWRAPRRWFKSARSWLRRRAHA